MLTFFRKIRQRLFSENKFTKYLIYAIGEILLVVVGILLALQVNNWNNERADGKRELKILNEMNQNLDMNMKRFSGEIERQDSIIRNIDIVMYQVKSGLMYHDSMGTKYASIAWTEEFNFANSSFESLQTYGLDLISSDSLRENIINLFNVRYVSISDVIDKVSGFEYAELIRHWHKYIEYDKQGNAVVIDFNNLKSDKKFTNMLSGRRVWKMDLISIYKELIKESNLLSIMIEKELNRRSK